MVCVNNGILSTAVSLRVCSPAEVPQTPPPSYIYYMYTHLPTSCFRLDTAVPPRLLLASLTRM